ncbi:MAG: Ig-like domain-containing protein [Erysipelotrichaceae bacterium]|nr:Ig-like domain-containing protein [Erysipelotrichaceae bacterium]
MILSKPIKMMLKVMICLSMLFVMLPNTLIKIEAAGDYIVSDISASGTITQVGTYSSFEEAKAAMVNYSNGIVTHAASYSPSKIIAMTRGVAVSYSFREGSSTDGMYRTMTITQYEGSVTNQKETYTASHYDMQYLGTTSYNASTGNGRVHVVISGFNGYCNLKQVDLVPMVYLENNLSFSLGGSTYVSDYEQSFTLNNLKQTQFTVSGNELVFQTWSFYSMTSRNNTAIGIKADWMVDGAVYYSYDFNNFYTDRNCTNLAGTYYNYYQYLPLRSKTNVTAAQLNTYLATKKSSGTMLNNAQYFISAQNTYGTNALLLYAIACQESAYGTSYYAVNRNNLFGINAVDSDPSQATYFTSVEACINDMSGWFLRKYMDITDTRFFGTHLGSKESGFNVKYASDPYWGVQIAAIAYSIDKSAGLVDYNYYTIGVVNEYNVAVKAQASSSAATWYSTAYGATYQQDFTVIVNRLVNGFYELPTCNPISSGSIVTTNSVRETYDFLTSIGYIESSKITVLSNSRYNASALPNPITSVLYPEFITDGNVLSLSAFTYDSGGLDISGYAFNKGLGAKSLTSVSHALVFINTVTAAETVITLTDGSLDTAINSLYSIKDLSFSGSTFTGSDLSLQSLAVGKYKVVLRVTYAGYLSPIDMSINLTEVPDISAVSDSMVFSKEDNDLYLAVGLVLNKYQMTIEKGSEEQLEVSVNTSGDAVTWTSSDETIATVDATGKVTAVGAGTAKITASAGNYSVACDVTVQVSLTGITLNKNMIAMEKNSDETLTVDYAPADTTAEKTPVWSSSDENVATVDSTGKVHAVSAGTAVITATVGSFSAECEVTVVISLSGIQLNQTALNMEKGSEETLSVSYSPTDTTADRTVVFTSSNDSVATVDPYGKITAVGIGNAVITARAGELSAECNVTVVISITSINLNKTAATIEKAATEILTVTISPSDTTEDKTVIWTSSNNDVATVDDTGKITAVSGGYATITASVNGHSASCEVFVPVALVSIVIDDSETAVEMGDTLTLNVNFNPIDTTDDKTVDWSSSDDAVLTIDSSGKITPVSEGTAVVTAAVGSFTATLEITVTKNMNEWLTELSCASVMYGNEVTPLADAEMGEVVFEYKLQNAEDSTYTTVKPTAVGSYTVRATVEETADYNGLSDTRDFDIIVVEILKKTLMLEGAISIAYLTDVQHMDNVVQYGVLFWNTAADEYLYNTQTDIDTAGDETTYDGKTAYLFKYGNIAAKEMNDTVRCRTFAQMQDGSYVYGPVIEYSVVTYAMNKINDSTVGSKLKTLLIRMLNYGAAAQVYFNYRTDALANNQLSSSQKSISSVSLTSASAVLTDDLTKQTDYSIAKKTLILEGAISISYLVTKPEILSTDIEEFGQLFWTQTEYNEASVHDYDHAGSRTITKSETTLGSTAYYTMSLNNIAAKMMRDRYYTRVYVKYTDGSYAYSDIITYSISDYAASILKSTSSSNMRNLLNAMISYGDAAKTYFGY